MDILYSRDTRCQVDILSYQTRELSVLYHITHDFTEFYNYAYRYLKLAIQDLSVWY